MAEQELGGGIIRSEKYEVEVSEEMKSGIRLALLRLDQVLESYSLENSSQLASSFESYINSMTNIVGWDGAFLYGILKVLGAVKSFADSQKSPKEIVKEVRAMFKSEETLKTFDESLTKEEVRLRNKMVRALALQFHPESQNVRSLDKEEAEKMIDIFKTRISQAIQEDGRRGFEALKSLLEEFHLVVEE